MDKKYELTDEVNERGLYRIAALRDIPRHGVKAGDFGGFVRSESNLSQEGDAWIQDNAWVRGSAQVFGNACVFENADVSERARIFGDALVYENASIYGNAQVSGNVRVYGNVCIDSNVIVSDNAIVCGNAWIYDNARVSGSVQVYGNVEISGNTQVSGNVTVYGNSWLFGDAKVCSDTDYIVFKNWWSSKRYFTWTRSNNMWKVGCFYGTGKELIAKAEKDSELSGREYRRAVEYVESILKDETSTKKKVIHRDSKGRFCKSK